jgi:protein gp37
MKMHHPNPKVHELYEGTVRKINGKLEWTGRINLASSERLEKPLRWRKPRTVFVCSMGDLFHEDVSDEFISRVWRTMLFASQHTFQVLTKRPRRIASLLRQGAIWAKHWNFDQPLPNVWLGVTVEKPEYGWRVDYLRQTPAAVRFLSLEPLLASFADYPGVIDDMDWIIAGTESGSKRRLAELDWFRDLRDQCQAADVPFFLKQAEISDKVIKLPELDGRQWIEWPK